MGDDPRGSVVNRNCQLHDVDNVFVIDGSVHVTNGGFNPVLTHHGRRLLRVGFAGSQLERHGVPLMMRFVKFAGLVIASVAAVSIALVYSASYYYTSQHGQGCASCQEMAAYTSALHNSAHRTTTCLDCHDAGLATKLRHIRVHLFGQPPEAIHLRDVDVLSMTTSCQRYHQHEYAAWHAGPHGATYAQIFTNPEHNTQRRLTDDCFRCHGMHINGAVRDLVQPMNASGPWRLVRASFANEPAMPCMACHQVHREGSLQSRPAQRFSIAVPPVRDSLASFDRREELHFAAKLLTIPQRWDGP